MAMSIPVVAVYVLLRGGVDFSAMNATGWLLMAVVGIVHTGFAYFLYFGAVGKLPATSVAVCSYLDPVVAVLLSAVLIAPIGIPAICGAALILGSTLFGQLKE
jgi:drug/metabolite transporter (DMT)-like permease